MSRRWLANTRPPDPSELPSRRKLIVWSLLVPALALAVILTVVLPAELGIDPTGFGEVVGLTEMGLFKVDAARQFAEIDSIAARNAADAAAELGRPDLPDP